MTYTGLSLGNHQFKVRGLGGDNTPDPTPAVYDWIVESPFEVDWDSLYSTPSSYLTSNGDNVSYGIFRAVFEYRAIRV